MSLSVQEALPDDGYAGALVGRIWDPRHRGPSVVAIRENGVHDITAAFPAQALRRLDGWTYVPVMCTREIPVPGSLPRCIRVMMTVATEKQQEEICHVYLKGAVVLRPDLSLTKKTEM